MTEQAFAIIKNGNKQYHVRSGDVIDIDLAEGEKDFECKEVLLYGIGEKVQVGAPFVAKAIVKGEVLGAVRGPKVIAYKYKKRKNYRRKVRHRQHYTRVKITEVGVK